MPEPNPSLARALFERMGGKLPEVVGSAPVDAPGSAPSTLRGNPLGWALEHGMDVLRGVTGIGDQGPAGPTATNIGQVIGAALPLVPGGRVGSLLKGAKQAPEGLSTAHATRFIENVPKGVARRVEDFLVHPDTQEGFKTLSKSPKVFRTEGAISTEPTLQYLDAKPSEKNAFVKQGNKIGARDQIQQDALETAYYEHSKQRAEQEKLKMPSTLEDIFRTAEVGRMRRMKQEELPLIGPLVSVDNSIPMETAEKVANVMRTTANEAFPSGKGAGVYATTPKIFIDPSKSESGLFDQMTRNIHVGVPSKEYYEAFPDVPPGQELSTGAHEMQHALDWRFNPGIFKGHKNPDLRSSAQEWIDYFLHPAEHKAETTGAMEHFIHNSQEGNQETFDREFLRPLAAHYVGQQVSPTIDMLEYGHPMQTLEQILRARQAPSTTTGPTQLALPLSPRGR